MSKYQEECSVYVGNLDTSVPLADMEELVYELFLQAGPIEKIHLPNNQGLHKSYGFVEYEHKESVSYAILLLSGICISRRPLKVRTVTKSEPVSANSSESVEGAAEILPTNTPSPVQSSSVCRLRELFSDRLSPPPLYTPKQAQQCPSDEPPVCFTPTRASCMAPPPPSFPPPPCLTPRSTTVFRDPPPLVLRNFVQHLASLPPNILPPYNHYPPPSLLPSHSLLLDAQSDHTSTAQKHTNGTVNSTPPTPSPNLKPHNSVDRYSSHCSGPDTLPFVPKIGRRLSDGSFSSSDHSHRWPHRSRGHSLNSKQQPGQYSHLDQLQDVLTKLKKEFARH